MEENQENESNMDLPEDVQIVMSQIKRLVGLQGDRAESFKDQVVQKERYLQSRAEFECIWNILSNVNVTPYVEKKNDLSYISWANAWFIMMQHFPGMRVNFLDFQPIPGGTGMVHTEVQIGSVYRRCFLPVMSGFKNSAVVNPTSRDIGDAYMRCLVKNFALFGLGINLYIGEDLKSMDDVRKLNPEMKDIVKQNNEATEEVFIKSISGILAALTTVEQVYDLYNKNKTKISSMSLTAQEKITNIFKTKRESING